MVKTTRTSGSRTTIQVKSYITGRNLGTFKNEKELFRKFPKEKTALRKVMRFNRRTGSNITTIKQIPKRRKVKSLSKHFI